MPWKECNRMDERPKPCKAFVGIIFMKTYPEISLCCVQTRNDCQIEYIRRCPSLISNKLVYVSA